MLVVLLWWLLLVCVKGLEFCYVVLVVGDSFSVVYNILVVLGWVNLF